MKKVLIAILALGAVCVSGAQNYFARLDSKEVSLEDFMKNPNAVGAPAGKSWESGARPESLLCAAEGKKAESSKVQKSWAPELGKILDGKPSEVSAFQDGISFGVVASGGKGDDGTVLVEWDLEYERLLDLNGPHGIPAMAFPITQKFSSKGTRAFKIGEKTVICRVFMEEIGDGQPRVKLFALTVGKAP